MPYLKNQYLVRDAKWTGSVDVGRPSFLERIKKESNYKSRGRIIEKEGNSFVLREAGTSYKPHFTTNKTF